jgi:hypothetical protein
MRLNTAHAARHCATKGVRSAPLLPPRAAAASCGLAAAYGDLAEDPEASARMSLLDCLPNNGAAPLLAESLECCLDDILGTKLLETW